MSKTELDTIKKNCTLTFRYANDSSSDEDVVLEHPKAAGDDGDVNYEQSDKVRSSLMKNVMMFKGFSPEKRPKIPRLKYDQNVLKSVKAFNSAISEEIDKVESLEQISDLVYVGPITVCDIYDVKTDSGPVTTRTEPP
ncbi:hypothetical protein HHI36_014895 [Cryptolaemus montrouzieri]|uniref:Uncharacterized protein n=1 Tax=Cryptolaemus montrouzieri TaxID=559131 RepID=A0ABD2N425_9CUCU